MSKKVVYIEGKGEVTLTDREYVTNGGEGAIYGKGSTAYKIYENPSKMIPKSKFDDLSRLDRKNILIPLRLIMDRKGGKVIGFTMEWIRNAVPLCKLFTTEYRDRSRFDQKKAVALVQRIQKDILFIHSKGCLLVDVNELNFIVDEKDPSAPYFIDVNSYQTPRHPATAIMASVRDYHAAIFTEMSDWFSFGILAFQLFVGIHPFKGRHPDFAKTDLVGRMKANVSVFDPKVKTPSTTRGFATIPTEYRRWFEQIFVHGERLAPPAMAGAIGVAPVQVKIVESDGNFAITVIGEYEGKVLNAQERNSDPFVTIEGKQYIGKQPLGDVLPRDAVAIDHQESGGLLFAWIDDGHLVVKEHDSGALLPDALLADSLMVVNDRLMIVRDDRFSEIVIHELGEKGNFRLSTGKRWDILPNASKAYDGILFQNVFGAPYITIPHCKGGKLLGMPIHCPELKSFRVIDARHRGGVVIVSGYRGEAIEQLILIFDEKYSRYSVRVDGDCDSAEINFVTLDNGTVVRIATDGAVELFTNKIDDKGVTLIKDTKISSAMRLTQVGGMAAFYKHDKLYRFTMKR